MMDWDELQYILAAARARTLTGAAVDLGVTHTTVGRRLRSSEAKLGVRLFDRTPDGLVVTHAGQVLVALAERVEGDVLVAERQIVGGDAALRGPLRVSIFDFGLWVFAEELSSFIERYPSVQLTLTSTLDKVSLLRREADVALRLTDAPTETLIGRRVGEMSFAVYASSSLIAEVGVDAPYSDYPWIAWDERLDGRWIDDWLSVNAPGARIAVRIDEGAILRRQAVSAGMGAFFLPCLEGDQVPGLRRLGPVQFRQPLWLLTLSELRHNHRVRAFMDHMAEALVARSL